MSGLQIVDARRRRSDVPVGRAGHRSGEDERIDTLCGLHHGRSRGAALVEQDPIANRESGVAGQHQNGPRNIEAGHVAYRGMDREGGAARAGRREHGAETAAVHHLHGHHVAAWSFDDRRDDQGRIGAPPAVQVLHRLRPGGHAQNIAGCASVEEKPIDGRSQIACRARGNEAPEEAVERVPALNQCGLENGSADGDADEGARVGSDALNGRAGRKLVHVDPGVIYLNCHHSLLFELSDIRRSHFYVNRKSYSPVGEGIAIARGGGSGLAPARHRNR